MSEPEVIQPFPNLSPIPEVWEPQPIVPPLSIPLSDPNFPKPKYFRFSSTEEGSTRIPDINPETIAFDRIFGTIMIDDGGAQKFDIPFESVEFTSSKYGKGQPATITLHLGLLRARLLANGRGGDTGDFFSWVQGVRSNDLGKQDILVEIRIHSRTSADDGSSDTIEGDTRVMWRGVLDVSSAQLNEGSIHLKCADAALKLNEERVFGFINDLSTDEFILKYIAWSGARLNTKAIDRDDIEFDTVQQWKIPLVHRKMGTLDVTGQSRFTLGEGQRLWDMIQGAAEIDGVYAFVDRGVFWYISEDDLLKHCGKYVLRYGGNVESFQIEHSAQQSSDIAVIMVVSDTLGLFGKYSSGVMYVIVTSLSGRVINTPVLSPNVIDKIDKKKKYRIARYNLDVSSDSGDGSGGAKNIEEEARGYFREITSREFIVTVKFTGNTGADLFNRYLIQGTNTILDGMEFDPKHLSHHISVNGGGWGVEMVGTNTVHLPNSVPVGARFPGEDQQILSSVDVELQDGRVVVTDRGNYYIPPSIPGDPNEVDRGFVEQGVEEGAADPPPDGLTPTP